MEEQQFEVIVERVRAADAVVATLDPAVRSQAFAMLTGQTPIEGVRAWRTEDDLRAIRDELQGLLDSMNEMSEMTSMRLQMAMDRQSKFVEALSNLIKKIDGTQEAIVQNLKV